MPSSDRSMQALWIHRQDANAFTELVQRHAGMVYATCRRVLGNASTAEDVAQECFMELARERSVVATSLGGWLHRVAVFRSLNRMRSDTRRSAREKQYAREHHTVVEPVWDDVKPHLDEAVAALPEQLREAVVLRFLEGYTQDQVARELGVARSTAQYRIEQGVEAVRRFLKGRGIVASSAVFVSLVAANAAEAAPSTLLASLGARAVAAQIPAAAGATVAKSGLMPAWMWKGAVVAAVASLGLLGAWRLTRTESQGLLFPVNPDVLAELEGQSAAASVSSGARRVASTSGPPPAGIIRRNARSGVSGRVYALHNGEALPYLTVMATKQGQNGKPEGEPVQTRTDSSGNYRFSTLPAGTYSIACCDANLQYSVSEGEGRASSPIPGSSPLEVTVGQDLDCGGKDLAVDAANCVSGYVYPPLSRATVWILGEADGQSYWSKQKTSAKGDFLFVRLKTGAKAYLQAENESLVSEVKGPFTVYDGGLTGLKLNLSEGASIAGTVLNPEGQPVSLAKGLLRQHTDKEVRPVFLRADEEGRFEVTAVCPGRYDVLLAPLRVTKTDARTDEWHFYMGSLSRVFSDPNPVETLTLQAGERREGVQLRYSATGIGGYVKNGKGEAIPGANVTLMNGAKAVSDGDGQYKLLGVPEGAHSVYVYHEDYLSERLDHVASGTSNADFLLTERGTVEGYVVDAGSGQPITEFALHQSADRPYEPSMNQWFEDTHDADGRFTLRPPIPTRRIFVRAVGYAVNSVLVSDVAGKGTVVPVTLPLEPAAPLRGRVVRRDGTPVSGALVFQGWGAE